MICQFERILYQNANDPGGFMIAVYKPLEDIAVSDGSLMKQVKAVGYCLPVSSGVRYDLQGHWKKNSKYGIQYEVDTYTEVVIPTREGIIAYLTSGQIKGIGEKTAVKIYEKFGDKTLDILDNEPEKLMSVSGISEKKVKKIVESYIANRGARDVVAFLAPHGISPKKAVAFYKQYGEKAMQILMEDPYRICEMPGIGFKTADRIAIQLGFDELAPQRIDEGIVYTLASAETAGNLCLNKADLIKQSKKILETPSLTNDMISERINILASEQRLWSYGEWYYRPYVAKVEQSLAFLIGSILKQRNSFYIPDIEDEIWYKEKSMGISLATEQFEAVKVALSNNISIITGGPGTGKTTVQRVILDLYHEEYPENDICCCAPTGRAARRMAESTGYPASTIHKVLGLIADENGVYGEPEELDADFIIVDEASMVDIFISEKLFSSLKRGSQIVIIGDADQLPSVGPGAVLSELISSDLIPCVKLDKIFRQKAGSNIAKNSRIIKHGLYNLEYGEDFLFIPSGDIEKSADIILDLYMEEIREKGIENVALLSPLRQKTATGVNNLNLIIRDKVNPHADDVKEITVGKRTFRVGDRVMQIRNHEDVNNGDLGYITDINNKDSERTVTVQFECGVRMEYDISELDMLDLGYAFTVHKSQGAEFDTVLINIQNAHSIMLTRPLLYTAITRGKKKVVIVGDKRAVCIAIHHNDTKKRGTCLAKRLEEIVIK